MKATRILALLLLCAAIGFTGLDADAGWKSFKKKVEKTVKKDDKKKKKKEEKVDDGKLYAENLGTGVRKTGGTCAWLDLKTLNDTENLQFKCVSGSCNTLAVHGRTSGGVWKTLYQGNVKDVNVGAILEGKRSSFTHLVISVNGAHESYYKQAAKMEIIKVAGKADTAAKTETITKQEDKTGDSEAKFKIGDKGPAGGWIFYVNFNYKKDGWRYLEAAPEDYLGGGNLQWGCYKNRKSVSGAKGTALGTGKTNTNAIIKSCSDSNAAARATLSFTYGGKKDWYLPSIDELALMETNLYEKGIGNFKAYGYWSSSEAETTKGYARLFGYEKKNSVLFKDSDNVVRAVRAFSDND